MPPVNAHWRSWVRAELPDGQALTPPPAGGPPGSQRERERGRGASATLAHTLRLARRGAARRTTRASSAAQVVLIAYFASLAMAAGSPLHSSFFEAHHGGPDLPFWLHLIRDGLLALAANVPITVLLLAAMTRFRRGGLRRSLRPASRHAL